MEAFVQPPNFRWRFDAGGCSVTLSLASARAGGPVGGSFRERGDVAQHPHVNGVDDGVRPETPVDFRGHVRPVPGPSDETGPPIGERLQKKLTACRLEVAVEVRRSRTIPESPLAHRVGR